MSNQNIQILELAKQGLTAAEIAEALGYDIGDVEYVLKFDPEMVKALEKVEVVKNNQKELMDVEIDKLAPLAVRVMKELIIGAEKDSVRADLAKFVVEHQLGMKQPKTEIVVNNIAIFNDRLSKSRERLKKIQEQNMIDMGEAQVA